jgi:predicted patatin/cPLA2 family phospholipase
VTGAPEVTSDHPVLRQIADRLAGCTQAGTRLALAIEGGGMRAAVTSGMCAALESYGIPPDIFDVVYGSSAGSVIASFYLADQIRFGTPVFYEDITTREFIDLRRAIARQPIMRLDYLVRYVITAKKPLKYERVLSSGKLRIIATDITKARREILGPPKTLNELQDFLQASTSIPMIAGPPFVIDGVPYVDASVSEAIPWQAAFDDGATHVLVLSSRPLGVGKSPSLANSISQWVWTRNADLSLKELVRARVGSSAERAKQLQSMTLDPRSSGSHAYAICPALTASTVSQLTQSPSALIKACQSGFRATAETFGFEPPSSFSTAGFFDRLNAKESAQ